MINIPRLIGHRGASGYAPENTIAAFEKAAELGATMVEFDVMLTEDKIPVVIHDENIKRTTNGKGLVNTFDYQSLQSYDAGRWFSKKFKEQRIPTFEQVLTRLDALNLQANVEIKPIKGDESATVAQVLSCINQFWPLDKPELLISSFDYSVLEQVRQLAPDQPLGLLMHEWQSDWLAKAQAIDCITIHLNYKILTSKRIDEIKQQGYPILAYTVNRVRKAQKLFKMGVDSIFSDYPDLAIS